jgi:tRNA (mo5U34)-methyltransferase
MELAPGVTTHGQTDPAVATLPRIDLPADLTGKNVLDIGAWDGFFSFECARRGAGHVLAIDTWEGSPTGRAGFDLAKKTLNAQQVYGRLLDLFHPDLNPDNYGTYDLVLFMGVLYHLRHPLLGLEKAASMVSPGGLLIVESHVDLLNVPYPAMRFYPGAEVNDDATNWFGPNPACIDAMLKDIGFANVRMVSGAGENRVCFHAAKAATQ